MHPTMIMALADEVHRDRRRARRCCEQRSLRSGDLRRRSDGAWAAGGLTRRLLAGNSLLLRASQPLTNR
jgi:hypothetical protein